MNLAKAQSSNKKLSNPEYYSAVLLSRFYPDLKKNSLSRYNPDFILVFEKIWIKSG
jgi:hypothetical protein